MRILNRWRILKVTSNCILIPLDYKKRKARMSTKMITATVNIHNSIKTIRPSIIIPKVEEIEEKKAPKKAPPKAKGKVVVEVEPEVPKESSTERDLKILDENSVMDISIHSLNEKDNFNEELRKRTYGLMNK